MRWLRTLGLLAVAGLSVLYIANPTVGVFELIPDNLPGVGNLDEAGATALLLWSLRALRRKKRLRESDAPKSD